MLCRAQAQSAAAAAEASALESSKHARLSHTIAALAAAQAAAQSFNMVRVQPPFSKTVLLFLLPDTMPLSPSRTPMMLR